MNDWDRRFSGADYTYGKEPNDFLREVAGRIPPGRVVSIGEGEGRNGTYLASLGLEVTGVDGSEVGLRKAEELANERGVALRTVHADLATYTFEPGLAGVVSVFCHLPAALRRSVHRAAAAALAPSGAFVLEAYTPEQLKHGTGGPPVRDLLVTLDDLREDLQGLTFAIGREVEREIHEGKLHHGLSATVQVLAFKP